MKACIDCGHMFIARFLSRRGLCKACGLARMRSAAKQIRDKEGPVYERFRRGVQLARGHRSQQNRS